MIYWRLESNMVRALDMYVIKVLRRRILWKALNR
jgi:hypothetical protein